MFVPVMNLKWPELFLEFLQICFAAQTPANGMVDQGSKSSGSQTAWMMVAILFLVIAITAIVLSTFMGYLLYKKTKTFKGSFTARSDYDTKEPGKDGNSVETKYFNLRIFAVKNVVTKY